VNTQLTDDDRAALLEWDVAVITVETGGEHLQLWVTAPDSEQARGVVRDRFGPDVEVSVCGSEPREIRPAPCVGYLDRGCGKLGFYYELRGDQHVDRIEVTEDKHCLIVLGFICTPVVEPGGDCEESSRYTKWLEEPLGDRIVIDSFTREPVLRLH